MTQSLVRVYFERTHPAAKLPSRESERAAGFDVSCVEEFTILPGERKLVSTGWKIAPPARYEVQVRPRSGLAYKKGITVLNTPGTVDEDYRGPLYVLLINHSDSPVRFSAGSRIAQIVIKPVEYCAKMIEVDQLDSTERGEEGFGSTGV